MEYSEQGFEGVPDDLVPRHVLAGRTVNRCIDFFVQKYCDESKLSRPRPRVFLGTRTDMAGGYQPDENFILWGIIVNPGNRATAGEEVGHWLYCASNPDSRISKFKIKKEYSPDELKIRNLHELMGMYAALIYTTGSDEVLEPVTDKTPDTHAQGYKKARIIWDAHGDKKFQELLFMRLEDALTLVDRIAPIE